MAGEMVTFALLSLSSIIIIVNPLGATLTFVSLTSSLDRETRLKVAVESCRYALAILIAFALAGGIILRLFGITIDAFRIGGGILLFVIGMEMVYARTSRSKLTATEKYESMDAEDISVTPLAIPMIAGPGAITTTIVLMNEAT
ncbi:MAG TPA: NAAT family transporter, partial [Methanoregulaceae archaeon]|nr:NAAT family transporter [Methanoregulaceae archaeon]